MASSSEPEFVLRITASIPYGPGLTGSVYEQFQIIAKIDPLPKEYANENDFKNTEGTGNSPSIYRWYRKFAEMLQSQSQWGDDPNLKIPIVFNIYAASPSNHYKLLNDKISDESVMTRWNDSKNGVVLQLQAARKNFPLVMQKYGKRLNISLYQGEESVNHHAAEAIFKEMMEMRNMLDSSVPNKPSSGCAVL